MHWLQRKEDRSATRQKESVSRFPPSPAILAAACQFCGGIVEDKAPRNLTGAAAGNGVCGPTKIAELRDGEVKEYVIEPEQFSVKRCRLEELHGGNPQESAVILRAVLDGKKGPPRDVVVLNGGAALYISGNAATIPDGMKLAAESIDSGKASKKLAQLIELTNAA